VGTTGATDTDARGHVRPNQLEDDPTIVLDAAVPLSGMAPRAFRELLTESLSSVLDDRALESARLLLSEVLSMSVRHSALPPGTPVHVGISVRPRLLRITVEDPGWEAIAPPTTVWDGDAADLGLLLLSYLADRWGVDHAQRSPLVWFELELS
jgi:anti-sigma regulatory factor (Ser/Thr protein kinase)